MKKPSKDDTFYCNISYSRQDPKTDIKFWENRKKQFQKLIALEEKKYQVSQEINKEAVKRMEGFIQDLKKIHTKKIEPKQWNKKKK